MSNPFFDAFRPMSEEERAAAKRDDLERRAKLEKMYRAALPCLRNAQRELREVAALGVDCHRREKAQEHVALLIESLETLLVRPAQ